MKLGLAITSLFAASAAAKYAPGQDCRTNKGCDDNCIGSKWSVAIVAGDARLVCDPGTINSPRYVAASCRSQISSPSSDPRPIEQATQAVCDKLKGKMCGGFCYLTTKASDEQTLTHNFDISCATAGGSPPYTARVFAYPSKDLAAEIGSCKASDAF